MEFLAWLEQTDGSVWLRESDWGHPIILCFHAVGMGMVVGISLMYSARILGYARDFPLSAFDRLFGLAWFGFAMNARPNSRSNAESGKRSEEHTSELQSHSDLVFRLLLEKKKRVQLNTRMVYSDPTALVAQLPRCITERPDYD